MFPWKRNIGCWCMEKLWNIFALPSLGAVKEYSTNTHALYMETVEMINASVSSLVWRHALHTEWQNVASNVSQCQSRSMSPLPALIMTHTSMHTHALPYTPIPHSLPSPHTTFIQILTCSHTTAFNSTLRRFDWQEAKAILRCHPARQICTPTWQRAQRQAEAGFIHVSSIKWFFTIVTAGKKLVFSNPIRYFPENSGLALKRCLLTWIFRLPGWKKH